MSVLIYSKRPVQLFVGSYFFSYICLNLLIMLIIFTFITLSLLWIGFEMWRAPVGEENENGYKEIVPPKKLSDLYKKVKNGLKK